MRIVRDASGHAILEYGLMLGLAAMLAVGALIEVGPGSASSLDQASHVVESTTSPLTLSH